MRKKPKATATATDRKPYCKICKHRHWSREEHVFKKPGKVTKL